MSSYTHGTPTPSTSIQSLSREGLSLSSLEHPEVPAGAGLWDPLPEASGFSPFSQGSGKAFRYTGQKTRAWVSSLGFQSRLLNPSPSLRLQALSLASTQVLFLQRAGSSLLHRDKLLRACGTSCQRRLECAQQ